MNQTGLHKETVEIHSENKIKEIYGRKKMNAYRVVKDFEKAIADFTGAPYAVSVSSCSAALFLCCKYFGVEKREITIPKHTYPSVPCAIIHAGGLIKFTDFDWNTEWQKKGMYVLGSTPIIDSAKALSRNMYKTMSCGVFMCLSFHGKKPLKIGSGGMILTDSKEAVEYFKWMRFDGRHEWPLETDKLEGIGYHCYMTPTEATRGLELMQWLKDENIAEPDYYPDLSKYEFYTGANKNV